MKKNKELNKALKDSMELMGLIKEREKEQEGQKSIVDGRVFYTDRYAELEHTICQMYDQYNAIEEHIERMKDEKLDTVSFPIFFKRKVSFGFEYWRINTPRIAIRAFYGGGGKDSEYLGESFEVCSYRNHLGSVQIYKDYIKGSSKMIPVTPKDFTTFLTKMVEGRNNIILSNTL